MIKAKPNPIPMVQVGLRVFPTMQNITNNLGNRQWIVNHPIRINQYGHLIALHNAANIFSKARARI
jgi:hypothetical protein